MTFREQSNKPDWDDWMLARLDDASDDTKWLAEQLRFAWADLDELRDRIDDAGASCTPPTSPARSGTAGTAGSRLNPR